MQNFLRQDILHYSKFLLSVPAEPRHNTALSIGSENGEPSGQVKKEWNRLVGTIKKRTAVTKNTTAGNLGIISGEIDYNTVLTRKI